MSSPVGATGSSKTHGKGPWIAGGLAAAVVASFFLFGRSGGGSSGSFGGFPSTDEGDLSGLDQKLPKAQTELSSQVQDSFSMISGTKDLARGPSADKAASASTAAPGKDGSFIDALKSIADKKSPAAPAAGPAGLPGGKLAAMAGMFGGGGGTSAGGGGASNLSAPTHDSMPRVARHGAGAAPTVAKDRAFRSTYGDGGPAGAARRPGGHSALESAHASFPSGSGTAGQSSLQPQNAAAAASMNGGSSGGGDSPIAPGTPPAVDGKALANQPKSPESAASPSSSSQNPAASAAQSAMNSAASSLGSGLSQGANKPGAGTGAGSINPGTSRYGLSGDVKHGGELTGALERAGQGLQDSPTPGYGSAGSELGSAASARAQLRECKPYDPKGVAQKVADAQGVPQAPTATSQADLMGGVGALPANFGATEAQRLVGAANAAMAKANSSAAEYRQALQTQATQVKGMSQSAEELSGRLQQHKTAVEKSAAELEGQVQSRMQHLGEQYTKASQMTPPDVATMNLAVTDAQGVKVAYTGSASRLARTSAELQSQATANVNTATQNRTALRQSLDTADKNLRQSIIAYDKAAAELRANLDAAAPSVLREGTGSSGRILLQNGYKIYGELGASRTALVQTQVKYQTADQGLRYSSDVLVDQVWQGKPAAK